MAAFSYFQLREKKRKEKVKKEDSVTKLADEIR